MKILGIPKSDQNSASCRIRFYAFLNAMPSEVCWARYQGKLDGDVLYVQKNTEVGPIAKKARKAGLTVIYDMDDVRKEWKAKGYDKIIRHAHAITTDTNERALVIRRHTDTPVYVVPDCVDYNVNVRVKYRHSDPLRIVTFGHKSTVQYAVPYLDGLPNVSHICNTQVSGLGTFYPWRMKTFVKQLARFDVAFLAHQNNWQGDCKSNNRLLVCMAMGMPVIVTNTRAYALAVKECGFPCLCVESQAGVCQVLELLQSVEYRALIGKSFLSYAQWYKPEVSASKLLRVIREVSR